MVDHKNLREVLHVMREYGAAYLKTNDMEIKLQEMPITIEDHTAKEVVTGLKKDEQEAIKHKVEEVTNLMKLGDEDLINKLFPDNIEPPDEVN